MRLHETLAVVGKPFSRWIPIERTTPSGKMVYICTECGRSSCFPDKTCPNPYLVTICGKKHKKICGEKK